MRLPMPRRNRGATRALLWTLGAVASICVLVAAEKTVSAQARPPAAKKGAKQPAAEPRTAAEPKPAAEPRTAAEPKTEAAPETPKVEVERGAGGKKVYVIKTGFVIEGRIQKPNAFYVLQRSQINYDWAALKQQFVPRILEAVKKSPF